MNSAKSQTEYVLCLRNENCDDLEPRKVYRALADPVAEKEGNLRVVDESGEDYLYPADYFVAIELPEGVATTLETSA